MYTVYSTWYTYIDLVQPGLREEEEEEEEEEVDREVFFFFAFPN